MKLENIFRALLLSSTFILIFTSFYDFDFLIKSDFDLTNLRLEVEGSYDDSLIFLAALSIVSLTVIASYPLLFFYVRWSRELYAFGMFGSIILYAAWGMVGGYSLTSDLEDAIVTLSIYCDGIVLYMIYLSTLNKKFEQRTGDLVLKATTELLGDKKEDALWAKSLALANGNEEKAKRDYIKTRVKELKSLSPT